MKSGLSAGAVAGIVAGIVGVTVIWITIPAVRTRPPMDMARWLTVQIGLNILWGVVWGWVFSKVYALVPAKSVTKGLCFALLIWLLFVGVYPLTILLVMYTPPLTQVAFGWGVGGFFERLTFGLVLGALYKK